jgi:hypothetical protein
MCEEDEDGVQEKRVKGRLQEAIKSTARPIDMTATTAELVSLVDPLEDPLKLFCLLGDDDVELFALDDNAPVPDVEVDVEEGADDDDDEVVETTKLVTLEAVSKLPLALAYQFVP